MGNLSALQGLFGRGAFQLLVLVGLLGVLLLLRLLRGRGAWRSAELLARGVLVLVVGVVLGLTLRPFAAPGAVDAVLVLDPVAGAWGWDQIAWGPVIDNVALFVPVGALAVVAFARRGTVVVWLGCVVLSVGIETLQYLVPTGRVANTADVLANATGALVGVLLGLALRGSAVSRPSAHPPVDVGTR